MILRRATVAGRLARPLSTNAASFQSEAFAQRPVAAPAPAPASIIVVGGGRMGDIRCSHISRSRNTRLAGFVDVDPNSVASFGSQYGVDGYLSLEEALASKHVDGVWVCAPSPYHLDLIKLAAASGAHVAVEKPVAMSASDINECYAACESSGVSLMCAFQRRTDATYAQLRERVEEGDVGAPRSIRTVFRDHPMPTKAFLLAGGGDPFHDLATHDIDFVLSLVGEVAPDEVYALGFSLDADLRKAGVHDAATIVLKWGDSMVATLEVARASSYGYDQRCEVYGSNGGVLRVDNIFESGLVSSNNLGTSQSSFVHSFPQRYDIAFGAEIDIFAECIRGNAKPPVTRYAAALATYVAETALQSALRGRAIQIDHEQLARDIGSR